jgi:hypothetical protein
MSLINNGIEKVRAFALAGGVWADGDSYGIPRVALVKWQSSWSDKLYQVYVNGRYAGVTVETDQRQIVVPMPTFFETAVRIEVFAVRAGDAHVDFSNELGSSIGESGGVRIRMLRGQVLPAGGTIKIYSDNGVGEIDYDNAVNEGPIRVWSAWQDKSGFGMSRFGSSDFGYDGAAAVGFGIGSFGGGLFGFDAGVFEWVSPPLSFGVYKFGIRVSDEAGNESTGSETGQIAVIPAARPAEGISVSSFDKQTNELVLRID